MWEEYPYMYGINKRDIRDGYQNYNNNYEDNNVINGNNSNDTNDSYGSVMDLDPNNIF